MSSISFIHLSDIHFTRHSGDHFDLDEDLRNEISIDIKDNGKSILGKPECILISGDIAYSGKAKEYEIANNFLQYICTILDIPETKILCVPGNHDVDHQIPRESQGFFDRQHAIETAPDLNGKLAAYFRDPTYTPTLFDHIHEYNKFAGKFLCNLYAGKLGENKVTWQFDFALKDSSILRIVGLNSTIISNHTDNIDSRSMVLGNYQLPSREEGVAYVSLCHHPPECWKDHSISHILNERVCVQLYGHKHSQIINKINNSLIIGSGAMHPSRSEKKWRPRYNWLTFTVDKKDHERFLKVRVYPRVLNDESTQFIADKNACNGKDFVEYSLDLEKWDAKSTTETKETPTKDKLIDNVEKSTSPKMITDPIRTLIYRFLDLSFIIRSQILNEINLIDSDDEGVEHIKLLDKIIEKAQKNESLATLWERVNNFHDKKYSDNPFKN